MSPFWRTVLTTTVLLILSNCFMTLAWYGHLKFKGAPLLVVILVSWLVAMPEYALQVPANRHGHTVLSGAQLKIIQEMISIGVFILFSYLYLKEPLTWRSWAAFILVGLAVLLAVPGGRDTAPEPHPGDSEGETRLSRE